MVIHHADASVNVIGIEPRNRIVDTKTSRFGVRAPRNPHSELRTREPKTCKTSRVGTKVL